MKNINELPSFKSIDDFPETSAEFLDYLLEDEAFNKTEPHFTYEQLCDFASVFAQISTMRQKLELEQHLRNFQYSQFPLLQIKNARITDEARNFFEANDCDGTVGRKIEDVIDNQEKDLPF